MKYWVCINNDIVGPLEPEKLAAVKGFSMLAWACPQDAAAEAAGAERHWKRAISFPELAGCFFPDYPMEARTARPEAPSAEPPAEAAKAALPAVPPPSPEDAAAIAAINRKLDELLRAGPGRAAPAPSLDPIKKDLDAIERTMESLRDTMAGQGPTMRLELEPLTLKLDHTELELAEIREQVRRAAPPSLDPLTRKIDFTEGVVERIREDVEKQEAELDSKLAPISERMARTEKAVEEEGGLQREMMARIADLAHDLAEIRDGLPKPPAQPGQPAAAPGEAPPQQPTAKNKAHPLAALLLTAVIGGGAFFGLYSGLRWALQQASHNAYVPNKARKAVPQDAVSFAKAFGAVMPLEKAIQDDAGARRGAGAAYFWGEEAGPDGPRVVVTVQRREAAPLYYYFSVDPARGEVKALNRGSARALRAAAGR